MSAERFEISDYGSKLTVRDTKYGSEVSMLRIRSCSRELTVMAGAIRQQARDIDQLRTDLAAAVAERDRIKGDHDEAAHFGRHFIRDDPNITPRGAIIRLGDKCTDLFCRLQSAEQDRDTLRARLAAIYGAPAIARIESLPGPRGGAYLYIMGVESPPNVSSGTDLIARPAKD